MNSIKTDILIVGGGPAGMAAAVAAATKPGLRVSVVDDNPHLGGQIWRAELGQNKSAEARELLDAIERRNITLVNNATVFARDGRSLLADSANGNVRIEFDKLILAPGARERFLPFPGWTLPNIFGAAGLQALVKGGLNVVGKRVVVAGTGPLLLVVANYLAGKGALVAAVCEQTTHRKLDRFAFGLLRTPSKIAQGLSLRGGLRGVPYYRNSWITSARGTSVLQGVTIHRFGGTEEIECELLACGFHLVPNTELPRLLGCDLVDGYVAVDDHQQTSQNDIYCAGEPTGIGGVDAALVEGKIAGLAATGQFDSINDLLRIRKKTSAFAKTLDRTFELRDELKTLVANRTIVCRCEDVQYGKLKGYSDFRTAKLQTRCGMGSCQGRVCGPAVEFLLGWKDRSVRPPLFPVTMENL